MVTQTRETGEENTERIETLQLKSPYKTQRTGIVTCSCCLKFLSLFNSTQISKLSLSTSHFKLTKVKILKHVLALS